MKKRFYCLSVVLFSSIAFFMSSMVNLPTGYTFDAATSKIAWVSTSEDGKTHHGDLKFKSGTFQFDVKTLLSGFAYINMQSLTCKDIVDAGFNRELITEMRSDAQLNLLKYKEATFKIVKAKRLDVPEGQPNYDVNGLLKLKGIEIPVKFIATIAMKKTIVTFKADFTVPKATASLPYDLKLAFDINANTVK